MKNVSNISKLIGVVSLGFLIGALALGFRNPTEFIIMGAWGDLIGGVLNPIFSFLALLAVLTTIHLQLEELKETRAELRKSSLALESQIKVNESIKFENTFFELVKLYNVVTNAIEEEPNSNGRPVRRSRDQISQIYNSMYYCASEPSYEISETLEKFEEKYKQNEGDLGQYFRVVYNILRFIDDSPQKSDHHIRIFRAQFSNHELCIIFYNSLTKRGEKMLPYLEKFQFLDNLPLSELKNPNHARLVDPKAFGIEDFKLIEEDDDPLSGLSN